MSKFPIRLLKDLEHSSRMVSMQIFRIDKWTGNRYLKFIFPRIFALAMVKEGPVANFGHWDDG